MRPTLGWRHESERSGPRDQNETFVPLSPANVCERLLRHGFTRVEQREADYQLLLRAVR